MRAKELNLGGKPHLDKPTSKNYATIALQEIAEDKIRIMDKKEAEKLTNPALKIFKDDAEPKTEEKDE
jgi:DNA-directed RNA polymerase subunit K/omega